MSFTEALALPCDMFALIKKAAVIDELNQSDEGKEYLADCARLSMTEPDLDSIRNLPGYRKVEA